MPLERVVFQPPRGNTWRNEVFLPLCHGISALLMVHKATHGRKMAIFTGLVRPAPDLGGGGPSKSPTGKAALMLWGPWEPVSS